MELRALFGQKSLESESAFSYIETKVKIDPSRSPFISMRLDVLLSGDSLDEIRLAVKSLDLGEATFKVLYIKHGDKISYEEQRNVERLVGMNITGKADMRSPDVTYGILSSGGRWIFGQCHAAEAVWLRHKDKPQNYSTGLSTPVARALANIAVPQPRGIKAIDPCCGMGNVLIEALSMGIDMVGMDINPLAIKGARMNLRHFGYNDATLVRIGDMNEVEQSYDAAILDMPYNLCSVLSVAERIQMLSSLRRFSARSVIVSSELLDRDIQQVGLCVIDQCTITKGTFIRNVWLCQN
ncbi:TRM11 family SAM-dependent methyltransferase [Paenibacillus segetis]|uniref:TRM11 family SAM-dependent methyltransferase n=1 Tax=Paenibacillus segetis TaxID=1325360 RepID=UPI00166D396E|nr:methyltransferase domain-containing protein [Paenibacillus segetis]